MTACAMTVGMVPMALALERGSQMQAPLGLAVIGGLVMSTFATLLVLPSIFAVVIGKRVARSPSIYPDDPESSHYDPTVFADEVQVDPHHPHGTGNGHASEGDGTPPSRTRRLLAIAPSTRRSTDAPSPCPSFSDSLNSERLQGRLIKCTAPLLGDP